MHCDQNLIRSFFTSEGSLACIVFGSYLGVVGTVCNVLKETNVFSGPLKTPKDVLFSGTTRKKKQYRWQTSGIQ